MRRPFYKVGDLVHCWIEDGAASGWDRGEVTDLYRSYVWVLTKTGGSRYYHQGDTEKIRHLGAVDALAEIGRR